MQWHWGASSRWYRLREWLLTDIRFQQSIRQHSTVYRFFARIGRYIKNKRRHLLTRRSHKSFVLTRRRDYVKKLELPGF
jgi:hypothetical protein